MAYKSFTILIGNVGQTPKFTKFDNGSRVAKFSIAYNERAFTTKGGTVIPEKTEWYDVEVWGNNADFANQYISAGDNVMVEGIFRKRSYIDGNGIDRYAFELHADKVSLLRKKSDSDVPEITEETDGAATAG